jgi:hypothetical protein
MEGVLVHESEELVNRVGDGGVDIELTAGFAGDFGIGVGVHEGFRLGEEMGGVGTEDKKSTGGGKIGLFGGIPPEQAASVHERADGILEHAPARTLHDGNAKAGEEVGLKGRPWHFGEGLRLKNGGRVDEFATTGGFVLRWFKAEFPFEEVEEGAADLRFQVFAVNETAIGMFRLFDLVQKGLGFALAVGVRGAFEEDEGGEEFLLGEAILVMGCGQGAVQGAILVEDEEEVNLAASQALQIRLGSRVRRKRFFLEENRLAMLHQEGIGGDERGDSNPLVLHLFLDGTDEDAQFTH